ncbi:YbaB/EbfC family nucleoid-associated protein [Actinoplanes sp. GCM10030250]|uniref:YbaB/EbfC family nucleoid-associated protein n=1 Tax=Actinoplanes sp. GCM10030250 TaxID=3273376 RepID=UPI0036192ED0
MRDIDAAEEWLDSWTANVNAQASRAADLAHRTSRLTAESRNSSGSIQVTVTATGQIDDLRLDDRVHDLPAAELAEQILQVMRQAQHQLTEQLTAEVRDTVGLDSETGQAVLDAYAHRFPRPEATDER